MIETTIQSTIDSARTFDPEIIGEKLKEIAYDHACAKHPLFDYLDSAHLTKPQIAAFLANYDAHASLLRRLLLKAATLMPEEAVGYILENVRNEYGNGNPDHRHQLQLFDLGVKAGVTVADLERETIMSGVSDYISAVPHFYFPENTDHPKHLIKPAIAAGAITATEILAIEEFRHMQNSFKFLSLEHHIWFDHVTVECEHSEESVALALFFAKNETGLESVLYGLNSVLDANMNLYSGLLEAAKTIRE